jgi:colicin import membrane protein
LYEVALSEKTDTRMNFSRTLLQCMLRLFVTVLAALGFSAGTLAQTVEQAADTSVAGRYPPGSIKSVEMAEQALADVGKEREAVTLRFAENQRECYARFFVSSCLEDAKERRRSALERLRNIENEANLYERQARAEARDKALVEKRAQDDAAQAERERNAKVETAKPKPAAPLREPDPDQVDRVARHERKMTQLQAEEAADAQKRAENIAAYEKKVEEAREHQKEVERRKAEKEQARSTPQSKAPAAQ